MEVDICTTRTLKCDVPSDIIGTEGYERGILIGAVIVLLITLIVALPVAIFTIFPVWIVGTIGGIIAIVLFIIAFYYGLRWDHIIQNCRAKHPLQSHLYYMEDAT